MSQQNWYLLTGAPSTGKTTAITRLMELFSDLINVNQRMGYNNYPALIPLQEVARALLAQGMEPHTAEFQVKVAEYQRLIETPLYHGHAVPDFVAIADRTLLDSYVYTTLYKHELPFTWDDLKEWMRHYDHAFVFDREDTHYRHDGKRVDPSDERSPTREAIQDLTIDTLERLQVPFTLVDGHLATRYQVVARKIREDIDKDFMGTNTKERAKPNDLIAAATATATTTK